MTQERCPDCVTGECFSCGGYGGFQIDMKPPHKDLWEVCKACNGDGFCQTCAGMGTLEIAEVDTSELPLPFSELPNQPNDLESWEDLLT